MNLKEKFNKAIDDLYEDNQCLAAEIAKLGYPQIIDGWPHTAGVMWDDEKKRPSFLFNRNFIGTLSDKEFIFVLCHEAMHLVNMHIFLFKEQADDMKRRGKSEKEINNFIRKLNVAADCVVNDSLTRLYKQPRLKELGEVFGKKIPLLYGKDKINQHTEDMTAMEVFYLLPASKAEESKEESLDDHGWESFLNEDGTFKKEFVDTIKEFVSENQDNSSMNDQDTCKIDQMKEDLEKSQDSYARHAGREVVSAARPINDFGKNSINWNRILFQLTDSKRSEDIWTKPNRSLIDVYPDIILPSTKDIEREEIFVAIDTSGSIDRKAVQLFVDVVRSTPKKFKINAICFDDKCYPWDIRSDNIPGMGGTRFDIIEAYIEDNLKKYPKAIFVLTDGEGNKVEPKHPNRWCWLLYGSCAEYCLGSMKRYKILELLK